MSETISRNSEIQKQAKTWLVPEQIERIRDACLSGSFATSLQDRNETIITVLADTGVRVSELVAINWEYLDLDADPGELYLPTEIQKGDPGASYLDLSGETRRQLRRYRNRVWKESTALFPSREADRMTDRSVRNVITRVAKKRVGDSFELELRP